MKKNKFKIPFGSKTWEEWNKKKISKSKRRRANKKPLNKLGFEYKDRNKAWQMTKNMTGQEITKRRVAAIKKAKKVKPLTQKERYQLKKKRMKEWKSWF